MQGQGRFCSQPQPNPKGQHMVETSTLYTQNIKEVNAITTRSGKMIDGPSLPPNSSTTIISSNDDVPIRIDALGLDTFQCIKNILIK